MNLWHIKIVAGEAIFNRYFLIKSSNEVKLMFVDRVKIHIKGGDGGNGCVSFYRAKSSSVQERAEMDM